MPFTLIKGTFHVVGYSPDGDSLKLKANNISLWDKLNGRKVDPNDKGHVQLRVEGIDSLETHYGANPKSHQPKELAYAATDELLNFLNITDVTWGPTHGEVTSANDGTPGFILARNTGPYGRPICFVFLGSTKRKDGSDVYLNASELKDSLNYHMLSVGHAYPLFYETLFFDLRQAMAKEVKKARSSKIGMWDFDKSNTWFDGTNISGLENDSPILPKLFRRLYKHSKTGKPLSDIRVRLAEERITIIPNVHHTHFDTVVEINGNNMRMTELPEDLVIGSVIR